MTIQIDTTRANLLKPIQAVSGIVESKVPMPILANILIQKEGSRVTFITSDSSMQCKTESLIGLGEGNFSTTVSAKKLTAILSTLKDDDSVRLSDNDKQVLLSADHSRFELQTLPSEEFPVMRNHEYIHAFSMPCSNFKYMLSMVSFAAAQNSVRYFLNGVLLTAEDKLIKAVATDGHRLAYFEHEQEEVAQEKVEAILTKKTVKELLRLIPDSDELLSVDISSNLIKFTFGTVEIISKLIDGKYPDYQKVIPETNDKIFEVNREEIKASLQQAAVLTSDSFKGVRWDLKPDLLCIASTNAEMEEVSVKLPVQYQGEPLEIGFNVSYLLDVLNVLKVEKVRFALGGPLSSGLITIPDSEKFKFVVMPMSI